MSNLSFTYLVHDDWVEEVVSYVEAVRRQYQEASLRGVSYDKLDDAYDDFLSSNCAMLTDKPVGKYYESFIKGNN